jgi:acyl carrier protein
MEGRPMSDKDQIFQELQGYIVEQLGVEKEKVTMTAAFIEDLNADSLDLVEFAMGLEEKCGVTIADEELTKIKTVEDAVNAIVEKKA